MAKGYYRQHNAGASLASLSTGFLMDKEKAIYFFSPKLKMLLAPKNLTFLLGKVYVYVGVCVVCVCVCFCAHVSVCLSVSLCLCVKGKQVFNRPGVH